MKEELHSLKTLYYSQDENNRELAREIIKGNPSLKKALFEDVKVLYNAVFGKKVTRITKTMRNKLINLARIKISEKKVDFNLLNDLRFLNPSCLKVIQSSKYSLEGLNVLPDFIWGMTNLKELEVYGLSICIPKKARTSNIKTLKVFNSSIDGLENLPNADIIVLNACNIKAFNYDFIKNNVKLRRIYIEDNPGLIFDEMIFHKAQIEEISLHNSVIPFEVDDINNEVHFKIVGNYKTRCCGVYAYMKVYH